MTVDRVLMCLPTYFDIEYAINPWMNVGNKVDKQRALAQWTAARECLVSHGVKIEMIDAQPGLPDMTFTGDAGMVHDGKILVARYRHPERAGENVPFLAWLAERGYESHTLPDDVFFEGLGDIVFFEREVICTYGLRSTKNAAEHVTRVFPELRMRAVLELVDPLFYHGGLCIALLDRETVLYYPNAFTADGQALIRREFARPIAVSEVDAKVNLVCNNIPLGRSVLMHGCSEMLERQLGELGFRVVALDMSEFIKSGGSVRCLILNL